MFEHVRARTGWHHDIARRFFEDLNRVLCDGSRLRPQARVEGWLSATGLVGREVHVNAEAVENVHDGFTSLRVERIDETGDEKLNMRHASILIPNRSQTSEVCLKKFYLGSFKKDFGSLLKSLV